MYKTFSMYFQLVDHTVFIGLVNSSVLILFMMYVKKVPPIYIRVLLDCC